MTVAIDPVSMLWLTGLFVRDPIHAMQWTYDRYGPLAVADIPLVRKPQRFIFAVGARYNERVLGDPATFHTIGLMPPGPENSAQRRIRSGIIWMNGGRHAHYRRMMVPPFRRATVDGLVGQIADIVERKILGWPLGETVDLTTLVNDIARHVALASLFGADTSDDLAEGLRAAELINNQLRMTDRPEVRGCPINWPGLPFRRMILNAENVEAFLMSWAARRRGRFRSDDLLSLIVNLPDENGDVPTDQQIANHVLTLFAASYETCQTALAWTLFLIAQHPSVASALLHEVSTLPAAADEMSADQLEQCRWLDGVVKESMRVLPPVPFQVRKVARDTALDDCDVKAGTRVIISPFLTNRAPELYPEGDRFKPERWVQIAPSQYEYLAFSAGPRTCVGYWFALTFLKTAVACITRRYRVALVPGARIDRRVATAMWPSRGLPVVIHAQDGRFSASPIRGNIRHLVRVVEQSPRVMAEPAAAAGCRFL
jgi:cytochrome P450